MPQMRVGGSDERVRSEVSCPQSLSTPASAATTDLLAHPVRAESDRVRGIANCDVAPLVPMWAVGALANHHRAEARGVRNGRSACRG